MLLQLIENLRARENLVSRYASFSLILEILAGILVPWLIWYIYSFWVKPGIYSQSPKELPYVFPIIGHAFAFLKDPQRLMDKGRLYFGNTKVPFTVTVGGEKLYILTSPKDIAAVYKNNVTLSWDKMLNDLLEGFGVNKNVISQLWEKLPEEVLLRARSGVEANKVPHLSLVHSTLDLYKRQLLPGRRFEHFNETLLKYLDRSLTMEQVAESLFLERPSSIEHVSLQHFCNDTLVRAITNTLFGPTLCQLEPGLIRYLVEFNQHAWMLVFKIPQKKGSKLNLARDQILDAFVRYIQTPSRARQGRSWLVDSVLNEMEHLSITDKDRAGLLLMIYWAANINPPNMAFWMLSNILFDPNLMRSIKDETAKAFRGKDLDMTYLMANCPKLEAVYHETMRVSNGALSARKIVAPTAIGGKLLDAGNTIIIPFRQIHYNTDVFGHDPGRFDPERFLSNPDLLNSSSFKPFGGGVNYCPGRFLAKQEMMGFTALVLNRFDTILSKGVHQTFPELDIATPALGINPVKQGQDVLIDLRSPDWA